MASYFSCTLTFLQFIILATLFTSIHGAFEELPSTTATIPDKLTKMTHLHFYVHDVASGENKTVVNIGGPKNNAFTSTAVVDDPLTEGPDLGSKLVGRAQGWYTIASQDHSSMVVALIFAFMDGKYNGSTISMLGRYPLLEPVREMPIAGGTGIFRCARGYALAKTVTYDAESGDAVVDYNVHVKHG